MSTPTPGWRPLPDCVSCGRPTKRSTWQRLGGYCSTCRTQEHPAQTGERVQLQEWQRIVNERADKDRKAAAARADRLAARRAARKDKHQ